VFLILGILVRIKLGSPVLFKQVRPGLGEQFFTLYKFRTMTDAKDRKGNLLPDSFRLTGFGKILRATSLDELPEFFNILLGDMSLVGPRPLLVKDMVCMSFVQRRRHAVKPGLTGFAQINGRNDIAWEDKLQYDLAYTYHISFFSDLYIIFRTCCCVAKEEGIHEIGRETAQDLGDYLREKGTLSLVAYSQRMTLAERLLRDYALQEKRYVFVHTRRHQIT
jgi:lipopolysaccharide/colanic/teichoic acid biosynthesis glycosyltransferase